MELWLPSSQGTAIGYCWGLNTKPASSVVIQHVTFCFDDWARVVIAVILATLHQLSQHTSSGDSEEMILASPHY